MYRNKFNLEMQNLQYIDYKKVSLKSKRTIK